MAEWDTKSFLTSLTCGVKSSIIRKIFQQEFSRNHKKVWNKISYGDESTSSQTFLYFFNIFSSKTFFLSNYLKISTVNDLIENFKSEGDAAKYRYRKGLDVVHTHETGMTQTQEMRTVFA